jgi:predicted ATPase
MTAQAPVDELSRSVRALASRAQDLKLHALRFPNYRSLDSNEVLRFSFPITVLLGRNGTNKSSILHAIRGSMKDLSVADYWFETKLDAIPETRDGLKQSVTHTYRLSNGSLVESIKARAPRGASDPDYWEAVKPTTRYGFPRGYNRVPPLDAKVLLLDFRAELPAFDKYFYFPDQLHLSRLAKHARSAGVLRREYRKQDYLRRKSALVKRELERSGIDFSAEALRILGYILERSYVAGRLVEHSHYRGHTGRTIRFTTEGVDGGYSDAYAGSGESAAAFLVHSVLNAEDGSILLLDEPETSLHPTAQSRMLEFICHYAVRKSLQVIVATHSIHLAEPLPREAVRVLRLSHSGRVSISDKYTAREALHEVASLPPGRTVLVEDERAKTLVLARLRAASAGAGSAIRVEVRSGGTSRIFSDVQGFVSAGRRDLFIVLDGDHRPRLQLPSSGQTPQGLTEIVRLIEEYTKGPNSRGPSLSFVDTREATAYLDFLRERVLFLPGVSPESLVWSSSAAEELISPIPLGVQQATSDKDRIRELAKATQAMSEDAVFQFLAARFMGSVTTELSQLDAVVARLRE